MYPYCGTKITFTITVTTAPTIVILTYGMETTYFRFAGKKAEAKDVYGTALISLFTTSVLFIVSILLFINPVSAFLGYEQHPEYIRMFPG